MDRLAFGGWLERYVDAWRTYDEEAIGELFSEDARYRYHPWDDADETLSGREQIVTDWLADRDPTRCLTGSGAQSGAVTTKLGVRTHASCRLEACATREGGDPVPCRGRHPARVNFRSSI